MGSKAFEARRSDRMAGRVNLRLSETEAAKLQAESLRLDGMTTSDLLRRMAAVYFSLTPRERDRRAES